MPVLERVADSAELAQFISDGCRTGSSILTAEAEDFDPEHFIERMKNLDMELRPGNEGNFSVVAPGGVPGDFSRTGKAFDFHTDGLYMTRLPRFVVLQCGHPGLKTSTTQLADSAEAIASLSSSEREIGEMLEGVYIGREGEQYARPIFSRHPVTGRMVLSTPSRGYFRPISLDPSTGAHLTIRDISEFTRSLLLALADCVVIEQVWDVGTVLCFDNLTYVHARRNLADQEDQNRRLVRIWFDVA